MTESHFRMFALYSAIRDFFNPPRNWVAEAGVQPGDTVKIEIDPIGVLENPVT